MRVGRNGVAREEVIRFYATYERRKKENKPPPSDIDAWPWNDPDGLDRKLRDSDLKEGVLAAYRLWKFVEFKVADLLECAVVNHIFPRKPQAIGQLVLLGKLAEWLPTGAPEWWQLIGNGSQLDAGSALIVRPALSSEARPSGISRTAAAVLLHCSKGFYGTERSAEPRWAYLGYEPDQRCAFIQSHPELKTSSQPAER